ncbi:hypothetical protein [Enterococcus sp. N249-2]
MDKKNLAKLSRDLYFNKNLVYNNVSGNDAMRKIIFSALGVEEGTRGRDLYTAWQGNRHLVYAIIDNTIDAVLPTLVKDQFNSLADFQNIQVGDEQHFRVKNKDLFRVGVIASGTQDLRRQTLHDHKFKVDTDWYGIATYVEFEQFLAGNVDWTDYVNRCAESLSTFIGEKIYNAFALSYDGVRAKHKHTGTFDLDKLIDLSRHVKAASGGKQVDVYGTTTALSQIVDGLDKSEAMKDEINKVGYLSTIRGLNLIAFPDAYKAGTEDFIVSDSSLLLIPGGEKIVSVVLEGETFTVDGESTDNTGLQMDFNTRKKFGAQVNQASIYGFYKLA